MKKFQMKKTNSMKKDTFYFSHDFNAHNDVKILYMRQELGMEGYGIYWFLIESLADAGGCLPVNIIPVLAMQMQTTEAKINVIINNYNLFKVIDNQFYSQRLLEHIELRKSLSKSGKKGAISRWEKVKNNLLENGVANGVAIGEANGEANAKESKGKEIKEKESMGNSVVNSLENSNLFRKPNIPLKDDVIRVFIQNGGTKEMAEKFYLKHESTGWFYNGSPIINYTSLASSYISSWKTNEENKKNKSSFNNEQSKVQTLRKLPSKTN